MKVCIIGSSGHYSYALSGAKEMNGIDFAGIAPGSQGEDVQGLYKTLCSMGYTPEVYEDYKDMLDKIKPDVAVVNCFFGDLAKVSIEAMKRGINVFSDKPAATTIEDLEAVKGEYEASGVHYTSMFGIRYASWFLTAKKAVDEGAVGAIRLMNAQKSYKLGTRNEFYKNRDSYGGTIPWVGSHAIDWMRWMSGEEYKSVYAAHSKQYNRGNGDLELSALCQLTMTNEVLCSASIDYLRPQSAKTHGDDRIRIAGTDGVLEVRHEKVYLINSSTDGEIELPLLPEGNVFRDFLEELQGSKKCMVSAEDSFKIAEVCLLARISADKKRIIYI